MTKGITPEAINKLIQDLIKEQFWGKLVIVFENGKITYIKKEQTFKNLGIETGGKGTIG